MHNFKLTAQQRTELLTDMRAKMKQQPHILGESFKLHLASKAEIIEAANKLGLDAASYGTPAANAPRTTNQSLYRHGQSQRLKLLLTGTVGYVRCRRRGRQHSATALF